MDIPPFVWEGNSFRMKISTGPDCRKQVDAKDVKSGMEYFNHVFRITWRFSGKQKSKPYVFRGDFKNLIGSLVESFISMVEFSQDKVNEMFDRDPETNKVQINVELLKIHVEEGLVAAVQKEASE
jgi:hypothetical protein